jgi:hypothetical protein
LRRPKARLPIKLALTLPTSKRGESKLRFPLRTKRITASRRSLTLTQSSLRSRFTAWKCRKWEHHENYHRRLLSGLQKYSPGFENEDLYAHPQQNVDAMGRMILEEALSPESHRVDVPPGTLRPIKKISPTGTLEQKFVSSDGWTFIHELASRWPKRYVKSDFANPPFLKLQ